MVNVSASPIQCSTSMVVFSTGVLVVFHKIEIKKTNMEGHHKNGSNIPRKLLTISKTLDIIWWKCGSVHGSNTGTLIYLQ